MEPNITKESLATIREEAEEIRSVTTSDRKWEKRDNDQRRKDRIFQYIYKKKKNEDIIFC